MLKNIIIIILFCTIISMITLFVVNTEYEVIWIKQNFRNRHQETYTLVYKTFFNIQKEYYSDFKEEIEIFINANNMADSYKGWDYYLHRSIKFK